MGACIPAADEKETHAEREIEQMATNIRQHAVRVHDFERSFDKTLRSPMAGRVPPASLERVSPPRWYQRTMGRKELLGVGLGAA